MAKAQIKKCSWPAGGCKQEIVFLKTRNKKLCPVDVEPGKPIPDEDDLYNPAVHHAHHRTCAAFLEMQNAKAPGKGTEQEEGF